MTEKLQKTKISFLCSKSLKAKPINTSPLSFTDVSRLTGISNSHVSTVCRGLANPSQETFDKIKEVVGVARKGKQALEDWMKEKGILVES